MFYIYATDYKDRRIDKFKDKFVYFNLVSVDGCEVEITYKPKGVN